MFGKLGVTLAWATAVSAAACAGTYDYIVVGGGTAGVAVASRLSAGLPSASVLLLEAGPTVWDELKINVPGMKGSTLGTKYDWNFTTVAQADAKGRKFSINRGRVLGGCSAMNLMTYNRAAAGEYDAWEALGNPGWNWDTMLAAMKKSETFTGINTATYGSAGVGTSGPVQAVINRYIPEQQLSWIPTLNNLGVATNLESLGGNSLGVMWQPSSIDPATYNRSYSVNAYLPIADHNLFVLSDVTVAHVDLVDVNGTQHAVGVQLENGTGYRARREVILAAGAVQSPQLLERSGVGAAAVLKAAGIAQKVDLPGVGENMQDHLRIQTSYRLKSNYTSFDVLRYNATVAADELARWRAGALSRYDYTGSAYALMTWAQALGTTAAASLTATAKAWLTGNSTNALDAAKLALLADSAVPQLEVIFSDGYTGTKGYPAASSALYGINTFSLIAVIQHPLSRGTIHINASNPAGAPVIDPHYLESPYDRQAAALAAQFNRKIAQTAPLSSLWDAEYEPGLDLVKTDADWQQFALNTTLSIFHPSGTCAMRPRADGGVVDADLVVYGTANLRVVDASIIPLLLSGHVQTAIYGIAEIAAEKIIAAA